MKTDKILDFDYKAIRKAALFEPTKGVIMVKHPRTGEEMTKAEYEKSIRHGNDY